MACCSRFDQQPRRAAVLGQLAVAPMQIEAAQHRLDHFQVARFVGIAVDGGLRQRPGETDRHEFVDLAPAESSV